MARILVQSDNFNRSSLGADWAQLDNGYGNVVTNSSLYVASDSGADTGLSRMGTARWVGAGTFSNDQYSSIKLVEPLGFVGSGARAGVIVRASSSTGNARSYYEAHIRSDSGTAPTTVLAKVVGGTRTVLHSATVAWATNDRLVLEVEGSEVRVCKNDTPLGGSFTQTDTDLTTGLPGVTMGSTGNRGEDWEGGDIAADVVAPTLTSPTLTSTGQSTATATVSTNESGGTRYLVITTSSTPPSVAQVKAGQNNLGTSAVFASNSAVTSSGTQTFSVTGLTAITTYYAYFVHTDASANNSTVAASSSATTDNPATGGGEIGDSGGGGGSGTTKYYNISMSIKIGV